MSGLQSAAGIPDLVALAAQKPPKTTASSAAPGVRSSGSSESEGCAAIQSEPVAGAAAPDLGELTKAVCRGDAMAFTRFYDLYSWRLYKHLLVLAKGNEAEAREVLQTVVVKLAKGFKAFDEERRLWGWLCRLARNSYVDFCRARRRDRRFVPLEEHKAELTEVREGEHRLSASLQHALELLTAEERELIRAAYVDERPLQELANASGRTYKAVESRLGRLRRKLKTNLLNHLRHEECS
jgi:RNA polymerase sigma-70 factor, ECF subfamily